MISPETPRQSFHLSGQDDRFYSTYEKLLLSPQGLHLVIAIEHDSNRQLDRKSSLKFSYFFLQLRIALIYSDGLIFWGA